MIKRIVNFVCTVVLLLSIAFDSDSTARSIKTHLIAYGTEYSEEEIQAMSEKFDFIVDASYLQFHDQDIAEKTKSGNPRVVNLGYMHSWMRTKWYKDWPEVDFHEDWFIHDKTGNRIRAAKDLHPYWNAYLTNPGSAEWRHFFGQTIRNELDKNPHYDGFFIDGVPTSIDNNEWSSHINEESRVNEDGITVTTTYSLWTTKAVDGIWDNPEHDGIDYFKGGSWENNTITLGKALLPDTKVYLSYQANRYPQFLPERDDIDSWHDNMKELLRTLKSYLQEDEIIIINTNLFENDYLDVVDGKFNEGFIGMWHVYEDNYFPDYGLWLKSIQDQRASTQRSKIYLSQSGSTGLSGDTALIQKKMMFAFASHLLSYHPEYSHFYYSIGENYAPLTLFPLWSVSLGNPLGNYYIFDKKGAKGSHIQNGSFEKEYLNWSIFQAGDRGTPALSSGTSIDGSKSMYFYSETAGGSLMKSDEYIMIQSSSSYLFSAWFKGNNIRWGADPKAKLRIAVGWFDEDVTHLKTDALVSSQGSFGWTFESKLLQAPSNARYARLYEFGLDIGASGDAWIDDINLYHVLSAEETAVYARNFSNGIVLVNPFSKDQVVQLPGNYYNTSGVLTNQITLHAQSGNILLKNLCDGQFICEIDPVAPAPPRSFKIRK